MKIKFVTGMLVAAGLLAASPAYALQCKTSVESALSAVDSASETMKAVKDAGFRSRVRILVDDARMLANSSKRLCERESASRLTIARAQAQANSAIAWSTAAKQLAAAYAEQ